MNEATVDEGTDEVPAVDAGVGEPQAHRSSGSPPERVPADSGGPATAPEAPGAETEDEAEHEDPRTLPRVLWATTSGAFLIAVVILLARGDYGYAIVTFCVALAAAINLL